MRFAPVKCGKSADQKRKKGSEGKKNNLLAINLGFFRWSGIMIAH